MGVLDLIVSPPPRSPSAAAPVSDAMQTPVTSTIISTQTGIVARRLSGCVVHVAESSNSCWEFISTELSRGGLQQPGTGSTFQGGAE